MTHSPVKILYIIDNFKNPNAGTENQLNKLITNIDRTKFAPHLLVFQESDFLKTGQFPCEYTVLGETSIKSPKTWFKLYKLAKHFKTQGYKLAHIFFNDPSIICPPIFSLMKFKVIISRRDMGYWYTPFYLALLTQTKRFVDAVTVNSQAVKEITAKKEKINAENIHVIYNGYEFSNSSESQQGDCGKQKHDTLERLKSEGALLVFLVANIRPIKRIQDAVKALAIVNPSHNNVHFIQMGDGDSAELMALAKELDIEDKCHFLGAQTNVPSLLHYADIGLLCSESEGFSNAIVEYQLESLPVICSEVGGNPEAIEHGKTGYLYPCADVDLLGQFLTELCLNDQKRITMGTHAKQTAHSRYAISNIVEQNQHLYQHLLER